MANGTVATGRVKECGEFNWRRNLWMAWIAVFLSIAGSQASIPFLPYYVELLGIQGEGQVEIWTGLLYTGQAIAMGVMGPIWGSLADRYGRKMMVTRAMISGAIILSAMGFVTNVQQLFVLRTIQGGLTGTVTACNILVAAGTPAAEQAFALGVMEAGVFLGASFGPTIGGIVADTFGYRACYWITGIIFAIGSILVLTMIEEVKVERRPGKKASFADAVRQVFTTPILLAAFSIRLLVRTAFRMVNPMLPLFVNELLPDATRAATIVGLLNSAYMATSALASATVGKVTKRYGVVRILMLSTAVCAISYIVQVGVQDVWALGAMQAIAGLAMGGILATLAATLAQSAPAGHQGAAFGLDTTMNAIANGVGPMIGGIVTASYGVRSTFMIAGVGAALATVLLFSQARSGSGLAVRDSTS